jgi:catechol 2,3-dioxygenase-like lactoylglutathione lyase family enzyme
MHAHVSLVTLGVRDVSRSARFYEALGFRRKMRGAPEAEVAFFEAGTIALSLYVMSGLASDAGFAPDTRPAAFRGFSLAWNCASPEEVDAVMARALTAGGTELVAAKKAEWGGYHGHFADPDGNIWEVAHNPQFPLSADGRPTLPAKGLQLPTGPAQSGGHESKRRERPAAAEGGNPPSELSA